jgi:phosphatidylglycerol---prolipoprotein diacylglyceryl transferase
VHPIAFHIGSFAVHSYGVMMALAFLAGLWTATLRARREKISGERVADVTLWLMVGAIIGARIVYVTTYWKTEFADQPISEIFMIQHGGLVYYGGLIGATIAGMIYIHWKKMPLWKTADVFAPSIALGSVFGRIGCLLNGCCYGRACSLPWAISFPADNPLHPPTTPVHPTEIYDALLNLVLYVFLAWLFRRKKFDGQIFATYLILYAVFRSIVEYFRGDYPPDHVHFTFGLTSAQLVSVPIFIIGLALAAVLSRRGIAKQS